MKQKSTLITKTDNIKRKPGKPTSSLVPQNYIRNLLDHSPILIPSQNDDIKIDFPILYAPYEELPDWPSEADLAKYDFFSLVNNQNTNNPRGSNKNASSLFINVNDNIKQNMHLSTIPEDKAFFYQESYSQEPHFFDENNESYLPCSITALFKSITWKRMKDYLIDNDLIKQVNINKSHKNSHYNLDMHRYIEKIREAYFSYLASNKKNMNMNKDAITNINNKEGLNNSNAMNSFHSINSPNYSSNNINKNSNTLNTITDKKHFEIIVEELGLNNNDKNNSQSISINNYFDIINKEREIRITSKNDNETSDINIPEYQQPKLISWIGSLFQYLKDNNINSNDIMNNSNVVSSLISNIYPQKDGYPVYNPIGKYWIKLFYKGKFKKVEIDDYLPFAGTEFPLFPFCDSINEFWPSLLFKSLMKLYSYKIRDYNYSEIEAGDMSYLYSLSGLVSENILEVFEKKNDYEDVDITEKSYISDEDFKAPKSSQKKISLKCESFNNSKIKKEFIDKIKEVLNSNSSTNECISKSYLLFYKNIDFKKYNSVKKDTFDDLISKNRNKHILGTAIDKSNNNLNLVMIDQNKGNNNNLKLQSLYSFPVDDNSNLNSIKKSKQNLLCLNTNDLIILNSNNYDTKSPEYCYYHNKNLENSIKNNNNNNNSDANKKCYIEPFISYSITDFFYNGIFNMNRLKLLDFSDLKKKINDNKLVYKQLSKEQKIKYITDITNLRKEYEMLKSTRIEKLALPGDEYFFIKIMNNKLNQKNNNTTNIEITDNLGKYSIQYNEDELTTAIHCIKNKWKFPKLNYYENLYYVLDKERESTLNKNKNYETTQPETEVSYNSQSKEERWNKEIYQNLLLKEPHNKEKISKDEIKINKGKWFDISIINEFTGFSLLRSSHSYKTYYNWSFEWNNYQKDYFKINREDSIIRFTPLEIIKSSRNISEKASESIKKIDKASNKNINFNDMEKNNRNKNNFVNSSVINDLGIENNNNKNNSIMIKTQESIIEKNNISNLLNTNNTLFNALNSNKNNTINKGSIILYFNPMRNRYSNNTNNRSKLNISNNADSLYIILDLFALDTKICSIKLNTKNNSIKIPNLNMNCELYLVVNGGITPYGFNIEIFSDHFCFEKYSFQKYLTMLSFKSTVFNIPYPNLMENQYYLLSKYLISVTESTNILFEINTEDSFFSNFIQVFLVRLENHSNTNTTVGNNKENISNIYNAKNKDANINSPLLSHFSSFKDSKIDLTDIKQVYPYDYITLLNIQNESEINNTHTINNTNNNKTNYVLIFSIKPPYSFNGASFQLTINNDPNSCCIEELELTEPYEIKNTIAPNKSGLLFKGFLFPSEIVLASLDFNVYTILETNDDSSNLTKTMEKINNKLGKSNNINSSSNNLKTKTTFTLLEENVKLKCEIKSVFENQVIFKQEFFNSFCLENICLSNYNTSILNNNNNHTNRSIIEGTENKRILSNLSSFGNYYEISFYIDISESNDFWNVSK